ncbi:hypothetical protein A2V71_02390 [Candidatus Berkelbacteria bacterium RBG_13_40_8]|uniref:Uncharacterized protein n=1 Tax=Candidatus Berkelbacteria bacterium RBG_13_40_8 TaxID=1797467 RepID=A0A1F5DMX3_9BACT|nr:MAG: hypothetical protein A2V71_02390 [Candidatus Berkelbacteria bacterium RBG_13_40_8]
MVFVKILVLIAAIFAGILIIKYRERIVRIFGKAEWAEKYLGMGGTYTMWILIALFFIVLALIWLMGLPGR